MPKDEIIKPMEDEFELVFRREHVSKSGKKSVKIGLYVPEEFYDRIERIALVEKKTFNEVFNNLLKIGIDLTKKEPADDNS